MPQPARLHDTLAVVFDFDDTLAPDSTGSLLEELGVDVEDFWSRQVQELLDTGWDPIPAQFFRLIELSRSGRTRGGPITRERLEALGRKLELFPGVEALLDRLEAQVREHPGEPRLELYLLSCGISDLIRHTSIASRFRAVWANEFHFDDAGHICFLRRVLSHTEKTRYLFHIARGVERSERTEVSPQMGRQLGREGLHIPLDQLVYVGDGFTDVPCFSLMQEHHGISLGVYKRGARRRREEKASGEVNVEGLAPVDYERGEDLSDSLSMAVGSICQRIALRARRSPGEPRRDEARGR